jgi:hypothetical protein
MHDAKDLEPMEMRVRPSHGGLKVLVQLIDRAVLNLDPPPNQGFEVQQRDFELVKTFGWWNQPFEAVITRLFVALGRGASEQCVNDLRNGFFKEVTHGLEANSPAV